MLGSVPTPPPPPHFWCSSASPSRASPPSSAPRSHQALLPLSIPLCYSLLHSRPYCRCLRPAALSLSQGVAKKALRATRSTHAGPQARPNWAASYLTSLLHAGDVPPAYPPGGPVCGLLPPRPPRSPLQTALPCSHLLSSWGACIETVNIDPYCQAWPGHPFSFVKFFKVGEPRFPVRSQRPASTKQSSFIDCSTGVNHRRLLATTIGDRPPAIGCELSSFVFVFFFKMYFRVSKWTDDPKFSKRNRLCSLQQVHDRLGHPAHRHQVSAPRAARLLDIGTGDSRPVAGARFAERFAVLVQSNRYSSFYEQGSAPAAAVRSLGPEERWYIDRLLSLNLIKPSHVEDIKVCVRTRILLCHPGIVQDVLRLTLGSGTEVRAAKCPSRTTKSAPLGYFLQLAGK